MQHIVFGELKVRLERGREGQIKSRGRGEEGKRGKGRVDGMHPTFLPSSQHMNSRTII